jgi:hypothetical protein
MRRLIVATAACLMACCAGCGKSGTGTGRLVAGSGLDTNTRAFAAERTAFATGEAFGLVLENPGFRDRFVDLVIYSLPPDGRVLRARTIPFEIDPELDFLIVPEHFSLPFPGRYRIEFSQLDARIAAIDVEITNRK